MDFDQSLNDMGDTCSEFVFDVIYGLMPVNDEWKEQSGKYTVAFQSDFVYRNLCRAQGLKHRVQSKDIALYVAFFDGFHQLFAQSELIIGLQRVVDGVAEVIENDLRFFKFGFCEFKFLHAY